MDFSEQLTFFLSQVEGATGAALAGLDGIPIESSSQGTEMADVIAEYAAILGDAQKAGRDLNLGETQTLSVVTDRMNLHFSILKSQYFLVTAVKQQGHWGRERHRLALQGATFEKEI